MKNLETLIKLQKTKVDEQRLILLGLQEQLDQVIDQMEALDLDKQRQEEIVHKEPELGLTYADYLSQYLDKKEMLLKKKGSIEYGIELSRDQLAVLFEEQKRYEIARQNRIDEMRREEQRKERIELDEIGSISFERRKRAKK